MPKNVLILAKLTFDVAEAVILNGVIVHHEDGDKGCHSEFTSQRVTERLAEALKIPFTVVSLDQNEVDRDEWNFDDIKTAVLKWASTMSGM